MVLYRTKYFDQDYKDFYHEDFPGKQTELLKTPSVFKEKGKDKFPDLGIWKLPDWEAKLWDRIDKIDKEYVSPKVEGELEVISKEIAIDEMLPPLRCQPVLAERVRFFHKSVAEWVKKETGVEPKGKPLLINTGYRPAGTDMARWGDKRGIKDKSDDYGHWIGWALDFNAPHVVSRFGSSIADTDVWKLAEQAGLATPLIGPPKRKAATIEEKETYEAMGRALPYKDIKAYEKWHWSPWERVPPTEGEPEYWYLLPPPQGAKGSGGEAGGKGAKKGAGQKPKSNNPGNPGPSFSNPGGNPGPAKVPGNPGNPGPSFSNPGGALGLPGGKKKPLEGNSPNPGGNPGPAKVPSNPGNPGPSFSNLLGGALGLLGSKKNPSGGNPSNPGPRKKGAVKAPGNPGNPGPSFSNLLGGALGLLGGKKNPLAGNPSNPGNPGVNPLGAITSGESLGWLGESGGSASVEFSGGTTKTVPAAEIIKFLGGGGTAATSDFFQRIKNVNIKTADRLDDRRLKVMLQSLMESEAATLVT